MAEDDSGAAPPAAGQPNRTIQVDALTDVSLVENDAEGDDGADASAGAPAAPRAPTPPPLPPRRRAAPVAAFVGIVLAMAVLGGLGAHFLVPPAEAPAAPAPPPRAFASPPPVEEAAPTHRHLRLDDEFVIGAELPDAGTGSAAGAPE